MNKFDLNIWIQNTFQTSNYTLIKTDKGISNANYLLTIQDKRYIVRVPKSGHSLLSLQAEHESHVLNLVQDIDVPIIHFDSVCGIKVSSYIPDVKEFDEFQKNDKWKRVAKLLKTLHQKEIVSFHFDPIQKYKTYKENCSSIFVQFDQEEETIQYLQSIFTPNTLCHNDLVSGNILFTPNKDYLIDYEYAAMNDYRFDIASFFSENQITDSEKRNQFYQSYFDHIPSDIDEQIRHFEKFEDILWGYWANMLYNERAEPIYQTIAFDKMRHYRQIQGESK